MNAKNQNVTWRIAAVCCVLLAQCLAWGQEPGTTKKQMLKNELAAAGQIKLDKPTQQKLMAVIRELNAKYSDWEETNGPDFRRLLDESKKGGMSDSGKAVRLMAEYQKIKEEIKEKIDKELTPVQQTEFYAAVKALKAKEAEKQAREGVTATGMSPGQAVKALGLPMELAKEINLLIAAHEEKVRQAAKRRAQGMEDGQKMQMSAFPEERAKGAAAVERAKKITGPAASELDAQIVEVLPVELRESYRQMRLDGTDKERLDTPKMIIGKMGDGEFNKFCDAVFTLGDMGTQEPGKNGKELLDALVTGLKPEGYAYTRAMRMGLLELPGGTQIVDRNFPGVTATQSRQIADAIKAMIEAFGAVPSDKEKREALRLGLSKAVSLLSQEQRVWVVSQAEK
jgi:hypothetical protein